MATGSRGFYELVDLAPRSEPIDVSGEGPFMHFAKEFDGFRFVARFARIFGRDNLLDINSHDQSICLDQSRPLHSLAWYTHASALFGGVVVIQKINGNKFGNAGLAEMAPYSSAFPAIGKRKANFHGWVWSCVSPFGKQLGIRHASNHLPLHDTAFEQPFRGMFADDIAAAIDQPADFGKKGRHGDTSGRLQEVNGRTLYTANLSWR